MDVEQEEYTNSRLYHHDPVYDPAECTWDVGCVEQTHFVEEAVEEADVGLSHHVVVCMEDIHLILLEVHTEIEMS